MWAIFKVFIEFVTILLLFYVACEVLAARPGIEPAPPALEGEVLTSGPLGKSLTYSYNNLLKGTPPFCTQETEAQGC